MAKKKAEDIKKLTEELKKEIASVAGFNHEELRQAFIDFAAFMFDGQIQMLDFWGEQQAEFDKVASKVFKDIKDCNERDFAIAEKNFKKTWAWLHEIEDKQAATEAMAATCMLHINAMKAGLVTNGLIGRRSLQEGFKLIPKKITEFLRNFIGMKPKEWKAVMDKAVETI